MRSAEQFSRLVVELQDELYRYARARLRHEADADDAVVETVVRALRLVQDNPELLDTIGKLNGWLFGILRNVVREFQKRRRTDPIPADVADRGRDPAAAVADDDAAGRAWAELDRLDLAPDHRQLMHLHYAVGLSLKEAAAVLGMKPSTARSIHHRILGRLRAALDRPPRLVPG